MHHGIALLLASALCMAAQANPHFDPAKAHHTPDGFKNNYIGAMDKPFSELLKWQWEAWRGGFPLAAKVPTPTQRPDLPRIHSYQQSAGDSQAGRSASTPAITWIGHASVLVQAGGLNVLTDPIFSERASPVQLFGPKRVVPPGVALDDLPPIDVVVISHNHYDHLDRSSVAALFAKAQAQNRMTTFLVPLGQKTWFESVGISSVVELDWWQKHTVRGVDFYLTPVQHWSARGLGDRSATLWGGWSVFAEDLHWYFGGDAGYSKDMLDTRLRFAQRHGAEQGGGFDVALIPVGAYEPRWFMREQHMNPAEAVQAHLDLGAKRSMGIHWGTFALTDEPLDQPPIDLASAKADKQLTDTDFFVVKIGETVDLPRRK
ncbi:MBL fold metallo-hydrolase [Rhodoferax aquaticus]|uniref:MBL fold metallo-hydrolase n=2 Tax=Rhodoferax aquaticus TaxID=2527691 RepID=A0A515EVF6_9BURK|nr:MBL fold metallo-hydrolase [Rhodoferax aquaticus]